MKSFPDTLKKIKEVEVIYPSSIGAEPLIIQESSPLETSKWFKENKEVILENLLEYGAILFRRFAIENAHDFHSIFTILGGNVLEYVNRTSPRDMVYKNIYTSTSYHNEKSILMHHENSYSKNFNQMIAFYCDTPPGRGGETPIADDRLIMDYLPDSTLEAFERKGIQYTRNVVPGFGLDWKSIYGVETKEELSRKLDSEGYNYEWHSESHLRVVWERPAFQLHPQTSAKLWFNHVFFGHKANYDPTIIELMGEENLPFYVRYGDGTAIPDEIIMRLRSFYDQHKIEFAWQKNDLLLLDNLVYAHGRNRFEGERRILTGMS